MRISMFVLALNLTVFGAGCQYTPQDGITDPNDGGNDTSDNNVDDSDPDDTSTNNGPPAGSTTDRVEFVFASGTTGVQIACKTEAKIQQDGGLFNGAAFKGWTFVKVDGQTTTNEVLTVQNSDVVWCHGYVLASGPNVLGENDPGKWNKLLVDDRRDANSIPTYGWLEFADWDGEVKRITWNEPSGDTTWDTEHAIKLTR